MKNIEKSTIFTVAGFIGLVIIILFFAFRSPGIPEEMLENQGEGVQDVELEQLNTVPEDLLSTSPGATSEPDVAVQEKMSLVLYIQDKVAAEERDCGVTKKVVYQVPKTKTVANESLKMLFADELAKYGNYKSVTIEGGIAKVVLENNEKIVGLSSCESSHLLSVLSDTLTQYPSINEVELRTPDGMIEL